MFFSVNLNMKTILSFCLFFSLQFAKADIISNVNDVIVDVKKITLPQNLKNFKGIRFIDARHIKTLLGYTTSFNGKSYNQIVCKTSFELNLNSAEQVNRNFSTSSIDSLIVVVENFWINKVTNKQKVNYCHFSASFYFRKNDSIYFIKNVDSTLMQNNLLREYYSEAVEDAISSMLTMFKYSETYDTKQVSVSVFDDYLGKMKITPKPTIDSLGLFLTYSNFLNGKVAKVNFYLVEQGGWYKIAFYNEDLNTRFKNNIWGVYFNNELYIRLHNRYIKTKKFEEGYMVSSATLFVNDIKQKFKIPIMDPFSVNHNPFPNSKNQMSNAYGYIYGIYGLIDAFTPKKKSETIVTYPLQLNFETGMLE
jgi:hypothetical protein